LSKKQKQAKIHEALLNLKSDTPNNNEPFGLVKVQKLPEYVFWCSNFHSRSQTTNLSGYFCSFHAARFGLLAPSNQIVKRAK